MSCLAPRLSSQTRYPALLVLSLSAAVSAAPLPELRSITLEPNTPNVVSYWNDVGNQTLLAASAASPRVDSTDEERRPSYQLDLATLHLAIYDAVSAIDGRFKPFAITPLAPAAGASMQAAASAAAYGVLRALFPHQASHYQAAYERQLAAMPAGAARARGLALGSEVAAALVALRAHDGRGITLAPFVSGRGPGQFRSASPEPVNRFLPFVRPFALTRADQFRPAGPPPLDSPAYAAAYQESRAGGGRISSLRTAEQLETARFHTEAPPPFMMRNLGRFASSTADVAEAARLMAMLYVTHADALTACFEAKYFYLAWRPLSAIPSAAAAAAAAGDPTWVPVLPTPNHPEYPAGHSCSAGALGEALLQYYGTPQVSYRFDSTVTGSMRQYLSTAALGEESELARIYGGMHFRFSTVDGLALGRAVAQWVVQQHFGPAIPAR